MLASLLKTIEASFGAALSPAGDIAFWLGVAMTLYVVIAPIVRIAIERQAALLGMEREWIMQCLACRRITVVSDPVCEHCGKPLGIPWTVRLRNAFGNEGEAGWLRTSRWVLTVSGVVVFIAATLLVLIASGAWSPQSQVERLFVGFSLIAWAGFGWLFGRVLGIGTGGPISRVRDAIFALAAIAVLSATTTVATAARPLPETVLARVTVQGQVAQFSGRSIPLIGYQVGFEYLQIEHELAGFRRIVPLAIVGANRIDLEHDRLTQILVDHFWNHAQAYSKRGLLIRKRIEQFPAFEPGIYEVVLRGGEVQVRSYQNPPT